MFRILFKDVLCILVPYAIAWRESLFWRQTQSYLQCQQCELVFVKPDQGWEKTNEKAHYDLHENDPSDAGYRRFFISHRGSLTDKISSLHTGWILVVARPRYLLLMLEEAGHTMELYDIYYHPETSVLEKTYDFMTATEVIEHLYHPDKVWQQWLNLVSQRAGLVWWPS